MKITRTLRACLLLVAGSLFASSLQEQNKAIARRAFEEILSQGHYALDEKLVAQYRRPDITLERIGEFQKYSLEQLMPAAGLARH